MTSDLLKLFSDAVDYSLIRIKSDNCSTQYCCLHVFRRYSDLSKKLNKTVILYYGVNGHGRGLVDAMSGFGVKSPLRRLIIVEDYIFNSADELCKKMKVVFADDVEKKQKIYKVIPISELNQERRKTVGIEIAGCQKARMISFHADGTYQLRKRLCNCEHCSVGNFNECENNDEISSEGLIKDIEVELADLDEGCITEDLYGLTVTNSYVGLYRASNFEVFYLFYITEKGIASETMHDIHGHIVQRVRPICEDIIYRKNHVRPEIMSSTRKGRNSRMFIRIVCSVLMLLSTKRRCVWRKSFMSRCVSSC